MNPRVQFALLLFLIASQIASAAVAQSTLFAWGDNTSGQCNVPTPPAGLRFEQFDGGRSHTLALLSDGSVAAWGSNINGECNVPPLPPGVAYIEVVAGYFHSAAFRSDGTLVLWGWNIWGQSTVLAPPAGVRYSKVALGEGYTVALRDDGQIVAWGLNIYGVSNVPALPPGVTYTDVSATATHVVAKRSDDQFVAWGDCTFGQCTIPPPPPGTWYTKMSAGRGRTTALLSNGSAVIFGTSGVVHLSGVPGNPYTQVASGYAFSATLRADGEISLFGDTSSGQSNIPSVAAGSAFSVIDVGYSHVVARADQSYCFLDTDLDGFGAGAPIPSITACGLGFSVVSSDCNDSNPAAFPNAPEVCDGVDNDCDGAIDEGFISTYCTAGTTVHGCVPSIAGEGAPSSQATSGFDIVVSNVPGQRFGTVFYGFYQSVTPWAPASFSYKCVANPTVRTGYLFSGGTAGQCNAELRVDFNAWRAANPGALGSPYVAGQVIYAQGWFRDPGAPKQTNLSDGLRFTLCN